MIDDDGDDGRVGYGKPPKKHQFKPGQSGNPRGRPKGARGLKTDMREELDTKVHLTENGKRKSVRSQRMMLKTLRHKALSGDMKALDSMIALTVQMFGFEDQSKGKAKLSLADQALLAELLSSNSEPNQPPPDWPEDTQPRTTANHCNDQTDPNTASDVSVKDSNDEQ